MAMLHWNDRDMELNLRDRLACIVAEKISGTKDAIPEQDDYDMADKLAAMIENSRD